MSDDLLKPGGPHQIRRTGDDEYSFSIELPSDADGMTGRGCPRRSCSPGYFKVEMGTGLQGDDYVLAFCPYCREPAEPSDFTTEAQRTYAVEVVEQEVVKGFSDLVKRSLGLDQRGRRVLGGGMLSLTLEAKEPTLGPVGRPAEEELRRNLTCPNCGLSHAVYGIATWCPDCGSDIFMVHVEEELEVVRAVLGAVDERRLTLGPRIAARDIENALEDLVSILEAVLKILTRRALLARGSTEEDVEATLRKKIRNGYQNLSKAAELLEKHLDIDLRGALPDSELETLGQVLAKRHPITHNLGVVDRQYLEKARVGGLVGRDIRVSQEEVGGAIGSLGQLLGWVHGELNMEADTG